MKEFLKKIRLKINKIGSSSRRKKLKCKNPTIISNNCWGGIIYQYLGLKYFSPTIGLYFEAPEYIKFLKNFDYYIEQEFHFIKCEDSKYKAEIEKRGHHDSIIGVLDDVEIVFLHYHSEKEVIDKWKKRVKRINKNCILYKFNNQNDCTDELIKEFDSLPLKNKVCFTTKKYENCSSVIQFKSQKKLDCVKKDYYVSHKYYDIIRKINNIVDENTK